MLGNFSISSLPAINQNGVWRVLGCLPETQESVSDFPKFGSQNFAAALDPSQFQEIDLDWYNIPRLDQGQTSSCVGHGGCTGMEYCWVQSGRPLNQFNPYFLYGLINGGRDAGAMISDALRALMGNGICQKDQLPAGVMFKNRFPATAFENAKRFKLIKAYKCDTFEEICSAITLGFVVPLGIMVGNNFPNVDNLGVAPLPNGGGGGHCILGMGLKKSARYGWLIKIHNSWGRSFGINGCCYIHKGHFASMNPDAFAIQSVMDDPADNTPDDEVPVVTK
jgi:hypothetical protein